jgi:hypothetical protein
VIASRGASATLAPLPVILRASARTHAHEPRKDIDMSAEGESTVFDYDAPAELFMAKRRGGSRQPLGYRRFATAAEAIRFAVEEFPAVRALGAWMQVGDDRFDCDDIQRLYDSGKYPLPRRASD